MLKSSLSQLVDGFKKFQTFLGKKVTSLLITSFFTGLLWFGVEAVFLLFIQTFLNSLELIPSQDNIFTPYMPGTIQGTLFLLIGFGVFRTAVSILHSYTQGMTAEVFTRIQRTRVLYVGLTSAHEMSSSEILNTFNDKILQSSSVVLLISSFCHLLTSTLFLFLLGYNLAPKELILSFTLLFLILLPFFSLNKKIRKYGEQMMKKSDQITEVLVTGLKNFFFLKVYDLTHKELERGKRLLQDREKYYGRYFITSSLSSSIPFLIGSIIISIITYISLKYWQTEKMVLLSFFYIFIRISQAINQLSSTIASFNVYRPVVDELMRWSQMYDVKFNQEKKKVVDSGVEMNAIAINAENISFKYDKDFVLKNISIDLKQSDVLLVRGESGAGKSTLLALLLGLLEPFEGSISLNNKEMNEVSSSLPRWVAYSGPEPYLIAGTVRENLLYAHHSPLAVTDEQMLKCLERARLDKIGENILDISFNELTELSSGQKQRLSLARAYLRSPSLLVLDEATSHIDPETEKSIFTDLELYLPDMTTIIVSHRGHAESIATRYLSL